MTTILDLQQAKKENLADIDGRPVAYAPNRDLAVLKAYGKITKEVMSLQSG